MNILDTVGNTPLVDLTNSFCRNHGVCIMGKLERTNPGGSVKDRPALKMIKAAEESGQLKTGKTILEPTSGSTGIALAMIGAAKGYPVKLVMPECVSLERRLTLQAYGAEVILTGACEGTDGAIKLARKMVEERPDVYYMPDQFSNPNNPLAHYESTGPEIMRQTDDQIDVFVAGLGTTGTLMGTGKYLREKKPGVKIIAIEPAIGHKIQGLKNMTESMMPQIYDKSFPDETISVGDEDAFETTRLLAVKEGIFVGMSSGAALWGAIQVAKTMSDGMIVVILPDKGDRYLSTNLFKSVCAKCPP